MAKIIVGISIEEELLKQIDKHRGLIPRSRYVQAILTSRLKNEGET
jgi:metal-responsive CopG/Arc/MetJ family transcriptional regulator